MDRKWKKVPQNEFPKSAFDTFSKISPDFFSKYMVLDVNISYFTGINSIIGKIIFNAKKIEVVFKK